MGAGSVKSSDRERLRRSPGRPPEQAQPRAAARPSRPPPAPSLPGKKRLLGPCRVRSTQPVRSAQRRVPSRCTVSADLSPRAPGSSASCFAIQAAPRADGAVTQTALPDEPWSGLCGDWAAARGHERLAAPRRVHPAGRTARGARSSTHGAFNTMDRSRDRGARPAQQPASRASCRPHHCRLLPEVSTRPPSNPPLPRRLRLTSSGSRVAPGTCCPGAAGTQKNHGSGPSTQSAPFSRHLSPGTPALRLLGPAGVSGSQTAPFSSQPTQGLRCRLTRQRAESRPASAFHDPAPGAVVAEPRRLRDLAVSAGASEREPRLRRGGSGNRIARLRGAGGSGGFARLLGRRALQPWLKPTDENTERAAKS
ncbi:unnamed protein product [Rangifer tarandus platyrhynchus]|uniref:Uncharacterized protein n=1 Tax=Rangifer tarandus platyrhynchus TaxID=3082113 RepID=A0AC59YRH4_RANTA